ncbi:calcineurin-like phosphoesterase [Cadophora sp. MPI-SDFR-AT-0126]|nr:calcineurin-like phosphoesterase [Leotiomycetes sp. MPI-SDFR-AT-0126]
MALLLPLIFFLVILHTMFLPNLLSRWLTATSLISSSSKQSHQPLLRVNENDEFQITIFSDQHYGEEENGWGIDQDVNSTRAMNAILDYEDSDLVVLNGDLITGENTFLTNSTSYLDVVVAPLVQRNLGWASTYGNHDSQFNLSRSALFARETKYSLSYTQSSPRGVTGVTNYYLPVHPREEDCDGACTPLAILWFFDSQGGAPFQSSSTSDGQQIPNWVDPSIVSWFISESKALTKKYRKIIPSIVFVHIPPSAFLTVQETLLPNVGDESVHFPGLNDDVPLARQGDGWQDGEFMRALKEVRGVHSVYSGHDHGEAWCANWPGGDGRSESKGERGRERGPHLCFCKHSGYGGYGSWKRGARVVKLGFGSGLGGFGGGKEKEMEMDVETWVRMESGRVVQRVGLNETYGADVYPLEDGEE